MCGLALSNKKIRCVYYLGAGGGARLRGALGAAAAGLQFTKAGHTLSALQQHMIHSTLLWQFWGFGRSWRGCWQAPF